MTNTIGGWTPYHLRTQTYWTTDIFATWFNGMASSADTSGEGHVSFKELLTSLSLTNPTLDVDGLVQKYTEGYKWWDVPGLSVFA